MGCGERVWQTGHSRHGEINHRKSPSKALPLLLHSSATPHPKRIAYPASCYPSDIPLVYAILTVNNHLDSSYFVLTNAVQVVALVDSSVSGNSSCDEVNKRIAATNTRRVIMPSYKSYTSIYYCTCLVKVEEVKKICLALVRSRDLGLELIPE